MSRSKAERHTSPHPGRRHLAQALGAPGRPRACHPDRHPLRRLPTYYYVRFSHLIDARLHGERATVFPRVFARPLELRRGQALTDRQLIDRLNDLGYAQRDGDRRSPASSRSAPAWSRSMPRAPELKGQIVRVVFQRPAGRDRRPTARKPPPPPRLARPITCCGLELNGTPSRARDARRAGADDADGGEREKRRPVALAAIPARMTQAVLVDRGSPLLRASRHRSDRHRRRASSRTCAARAPYMAGGQHDHAAGGAQRLPAEDVSRHDAAGRAREVGAPQAARGLGVARSSRRARRRTRSSRCI